MSIVRRAGPCPALLAGAVALLGSLAAPRHAAAQRSRFSSGYRSQLDTAVAFDKSGTVNLSANQGDIVVTGSSGNEVHVRARSDDNNIQFDATARQVTLSLRGNSDSRFEVSVPYGVRVIARTQNGDVSVRGTRGEVEVHAQNGDVRLEDVATRLDVSTLSGDIVGNAIAGDVEINSTSGDVKLDDVRGDIDVQSVSGDLSLRSVTAKNVHAQSVSGDVVYDGTIDPSGRYELTSNSGDIGLHVPRSASAQVTVSTWSGTIDTAFPVTLTPGEHGIGVSTAKRFTFQIGGGAARITAESFSGDVTISSNGRGASDGR